MKEGHLTGLDELRQNWSRWTSVVELFARRHRARRRIDLKEYESLHAELLAGCRGLAATGPEKERPFYQDLEQLAQPWLSPHVLEQADREILFDLCLRCGEAGRRLGCWTWIHALRQRAGMLLGLLAVTVAVVLITATSRLWWPVLDWLGDLWRAIWLVVKHGGLDQWSFAAGVGVAITIALYLFARSGRASRE